jgi:hypothetical protein
MHSRGRWQRRSLGSAGNNRAMFVARGDRMREEPRGTSTRARKAGHWNHLLQSQRRTRPRYPFAGWSLFPGARGRQRLRGCVALRCGFQIVELVNEFGSVTGPRVERVDQLFTLLVSHRRRTARGEVGGLVGELRIALGLEPKFVNSVDDEQNVANFRILTDYITSLRQTWHTQSTRR